MVSEERERRGLGYARFLEDVVQAVAPEVTWEPEITSRTVIDAGQCGDGVLWESSLVDSDVFVGWGDSLAENCEQDEKRGACETEEQSTERPDATPPSFESHRVRWQSVVVLAVPSFLEW